MIYPAYTRKRKIGLAITVETVDTYTVLTFTYRKNKLNKLTEIDMSTSHIQSTLITTDVTCLVH
jgi:hypothetical protein